MLMIKRRKYERIRLELPDGRFVWLLVAGLERVEGDRPRAVLGIDAPADVVVLREELIGEERAVTDDPFGV